MAESTLSEGGRVGGRFTLVRRLGLGGMGEVWLATVEGAGAFRRNVVLKCVAPDRRGDERIEAMLADEARVLGLLHHPGIVTAIDFLHTEVGPLLVLDYVDGPSLRTALRLAKKHGLPLPEELAAWIGAEVARALDAAHRAVDTQGRPLNIIHRDVSPDNVLLSLEGAVLLADFGVARAAGNSDVTVPGTAPKGKRGYMAPEQAMGQPLGPTADVFALGRVVAEAAGEQCGPALRSLLDKALAEKPEERLPSAAAFAAGLAMAVPLPASPQRALAEWLARAAPELHAPRETNPGATPQPAQATAQTPAPRTPSTPPPAAAPLFESVAPRRPSTRWLAAIGAGLALGVPLFVILSAAGRHALPAPLQAGLQAATGELRLESAPAGAEIYVDGQLRGVTPLAVRLPAGTHQVRVGSPRLEKWRALEVMISAGRAEKRYLDLTE